MKKFYAEHVHTDEEIRYAAEGSGYFDVRNTQDEWIRIHLRRGEMIVLPAGIYHRFTLDSKVKLNFQLTSLIFTLRDSFEISFWNIFVTHKQ